MARPTEQSGRTVFEGTQCLHPAMRMLGWTSVLKARPRALSPHHHDDSWEFCYIARGRVDWWVEREMHRVSGGQVYITRPNETHGGVDAALHPCELYWMILKLPERGPLAGASVSQTRQLVRAMQAMELRTFAASDDIARCFDQLHAEHREHHPLRDVVIQSLVLQLLTTILRDHDKAAARHAHRAAEEDCLVSKAMAVIESDLAGAPSLGALAKSLGTNASALRQRFVQRTGLTPANYIMLRRLDEAARLLRSTHLTVTQIAFKVGFSSSQYFATAFKKRTGHSPLEYRKHDGNDE